MVLTIFVDQMKVAAVPQALRCLALQNLPSSFSSSPIAAPTWMQFLSSKAAGQMDASRRLNAAQEPSATAPYVSGVLHTYQMSGLS